MSNRTLRIIPAKILTQKAAIFIQKKRNQSPEESGEHFSGKEDVSSSEQPENRSLWIRVYPPEDLCPGDDVTFSVRNPGVRNMPPSTSTLLVYFLLFS